MSKPFWGFFGVAIVIVAVALSIVYFGNASSHLVMTGTVLHVRTLALKDGSSIAVVDFRLKNTSSVAFFVGEVVMTMEPVSGEPATGISISRADMNMMFQAHTELGPKFGELLSPRDIIKGGQTADWMAAARFELPVSKLEQRKTFRIHLQEVDGTVTEFTEMP